MQARRVGNVLAVLLVWLVASGTAVRGEAAHDMSRRDVAGLRVGMTVDEIDHALADQPRVTKRDNKYARAKGAATGSRDLRAIYVDFDDDRFLNVSMVRLPDGSQAAEISLVYQGKSYSPALIDEIVARYGRPDSTKSLGADRILAWGGEAETAGAITPYNGVATTLRAEEVDHKQVTLTLTAHKLIKAAEAAR
jgi:hypothetical protein